MFKGLKKLIGGDMITLASDAPKDWPEIKVLEKHLEDQEYFIKECAHQLDKKVLKKTTKPESKSFLTPKGILFGVPTCTLGKKKVAIYLYRTADQKTGKTHAAIKKFLKTKGIEAYYYAPKKLKLVAGGNPFGELDPNHFQLLKKAPKNTYAMWWATKKQKKIYRSPTEKSITKTYKALHGIETAFYGMFANAFGFIDSPQRVKLPDEPIFLPILGPENEIFLMNVSQEKGIRLQFSKKTSHEYAETMWALFAKLAEKVKKTAKKHKWDLDQYEDGLCPSDWWSAMLVGYTTQSKTMKGAEEIAVGLAMID